MADLLGDLLADPDRDLLPHIVTLLLGLLGALLLGLFEADLAMDLVTLKVGHIATLLLRDITALGPAGAKDGHPEPALALPVAEALVVTVFPILGLPSFAAAGDRHPLQVIALALPVVVTVGAALCLCVPPTHLPMHCLALLLIHGFALKNDAKK